MNKAIIFDLDGTIIDSAPDILDNLNIMLENYGYPKIELKRVTEIIGHGARNLVKGAVNKPLDEKVLDEYLKFYNNIYTANANKKTILYDGIMETIKKLRDMGYKLAICTNKPQMTLDALVSEIFTDVSFDYICGFKEGRILKPDKRAILPILSALDCQPENTYIIGDMATDYLSAINCGAKPITVLWGYGKKSDLSKLGATVFANTPQDILSIIN